MKKQPLKNFLHQIDLDSPVVKNGHYGYKRKNPAKTFIGGVVCTLIVIYIIFPLADYLTDTLLNSLIK